eukprot:PhF_6_TR31105/c0_g1_i2/m.45502
MLFLISCLLFFGVCNGLSDLEALLHTVSGIRNKNPSWTNSTPPCSWSGIVCQGGVVSTISLVGGYTGTINLDKLPNNTFQLMMNGNDFMGQTPDLTSLPTNLRYLYIGNNNFRGVPNLKNLPPGLIDIDLSYNHFSGTIDFSLFPKSMEDIYLTSNSFSGSINLQPLGMYVLYLYLGNNSFTGAPILKPNATMSVLMKLDLSWNSFCGQATFTPNNSWCTNANVLHSCGSNHVNGDISCQSGTFSCANKC